MARRSPRRVTRLSAVCTISEGREGQGGAVIDHGTAATFEDTPSDLNDAFVPGFAADAPGNGLAGQW